MPQERFMQEQITNKVRWLRVETKDAGTEFISVYDTGLDIPNGNDFEQPDVAATIRQYTEGEPESWENIEGYGARLSAPGYLDCTEWTVFDSLDAAQEYLTETYRQGDISAKAQAGFALYASHDQAARLHRVLDQHQIMSEILSL